MNEITDYEPGIAVLTHPIQKILIKDILRVVVSSVPEISEYNGSSVYEVKIIGVKGKVCKFYSPSIEDRDRNVAELNWRIQERVSADVRVVPEVNRVN